LSLIVGYDDKTGLFIDVLNLIRDLLRNATVITFVNDTVNTYDNILVIIQSLSTGAIGDKKLSEITNKVKSIPTYIANIKHKGTASYVHYRTAIYALIRLLERVTNDIKPARKQTTVSATTRAITDVEAKAAESAYEWAEIMINRLRESFKDIYHTSIKRGITPIIEYIKSDLPVGDTGIHRIFGFISTLLDKQVTVMNFTSELTEENHDRSLDGIISICSSDIDSKTLDSKIRRIAAYLAKMGSKLPTTYSKYKDALRSLLNLVARIIGDTKLLDTIRSNKRKVKTKVASAALAATTSAAAASGVSTESATAPP
jgi:hypothetical protein